MKLSSACIQYRVISTSVTIGAYTLILNATGIYLQRCNNYYELHYTILNNMHAEPPGDIHVSDINPNQLTIIIL